ncbi:uncharacterized protein LOC115323821 isoform X4 [Ixodes scapularis]|uniref:uncharacterized protein LOC115323821 isoform X4 n=1 Tax=Ixodes scapularis TaxID=6945 RepID=UPI001C38CB86|nr:uncharacterized protein LOC115323821 isoform X4 [Ixodes scapularis]
MHTFCNDPVLHSCGFLVVSQLLKGVAGLSWATQCFARTFTEYSNVGKPVEDSLSRFLSRGRYALPGPSKKHSAERQGGKIKGVKQKEQGPVSVNITAEKTCEQGSSVHIFECAARIFLVICPLNL